MQGASTAFGVIIAGVDMVVEHEVLITLPGNPYPDVSLAVDSINVTRQLVTDLPDSTRLIAGYPSASATVALSGLVDPSGETKSIVWLLNPYSTSSPMYRLNAVRAPITIRAGIYTGSSDLPEYITVFTGLVDQVDIDPIAGTVTLTCIDLRSLLRTAALVPAAINKVAYGPLTPGPPPVYQYVQIPLTALWAMRYLLASNGFYTGPQPRSLCVMYASMHGSLWPEIGTETATLSPSPGPDGITPLGFTQGKWCNQILDVDPVQGEFLQSRPTTTFSLVTGMSVYCEAWVYVPATTPANINGPFGGDLLEFGFACHGGGGFGDYLVASFTGNASALLLQAKFGRTSETDWASPAQTTTVGWHQVAVQLRYTGATTATIDWWLDGVRLGAASAITVTPAGSNPFFFPERLLCDTTEINPWMPTDTAQITLESASPVIPTPLTFQPNAFLDPSLNNLTSIPDTTGQDVWSILQAMAEAEQGVGGLDELGAFRFQNRLSAQTTAVRPITSEASLLSLQLGVGSASTVNHIQLPVNALQILDPAVTWTASTVYEVPAKGSLAVTAVMDNPAWGCSASTDQCDVIPFGGIVFDGVSIITAGYRASMLPDGSGAEVKNLTMSVVQTSPTLATVNVTNPNTHPVYLVTPTGYEVAAGTPALTFTGQAVVPSSTAPGGATVTSAGTLVDAQWPPANEGGAAAAPGGEVLLSLTANQWVQDATDALGRVDDLLADLYKPRPILSNVVVVADPRLQLQDRATINDPDASGMQDDVELVGIALSVSAEDWTQSVDARAISTPGGWLMGVVGRSEMGVQTYV